MALTIRLTEQEQETLNRIQRVMGQSTASGCIRELILRKEDTTDIIATLSKRNEELYNQVLTLQKLIVEFVSADKRRNELLSQMKEV